MNRLLFGDNLKWLRDPKPLRAVCRLTVIFPDASVDLVYLDPPAWPKPLRRGEGPPFNFHPVYGTNASYNVLFKGAERQGQPQGGANGSERSQPSGEASQAQFHAFTDTWESTADMNAPYGELVDAFSNANGGGNAEKTPFKVIRLSPNQAYVESASQTRLCEVSTRAKDAEARQQR